MSGVVPPRRPRALLLTTVSWHNPRQGDAWRVYGLQRGLAEVAEVTVVQWGGDPADSHRVTADPAWLKGLRALLALPSGPPLATLPYRAGFPFVPGRFDLVVGFSLKTARWALRIPAPVRVLDLADSLGLLAGRLKGQAFWLRRLRLWGIAEEERTWAARFTETWVAAADDAEYLRTRGVAARVVPNGAAERRQTPWVSPRRLVFVGNLAYPPNRVGLSEFLRVVWPRLARAGYHLDLVGRGTERFRAVAGVTAHGLVEDVQAVYASVGAALSPVRIGAGSPTKVLEALSWGRPVVGWRTGFSGLTAAQQAAVIPVDGAEDWLPALRRLDDRGEWEARQEAGLAAVELWGEAQAAGFRRLLSACFSTSLDGLGTVTMGAERTE